MHYKVLELKTPICDRPDSPLSPQEMADASGVGRRAGVHREAVRYAFRVISRQFGSSHRQDDRPNYAYRKWTLRLRSK